MFFIKETVYSEKVCIIKNKCKENFLSNTPQNITKNALEKNVQVWGLSYNMDHFTFRWAFEFLFYIACSKNPCHTQKWGCCENITGV